MPSLAALLQGGTPYDKYLAQSKANRDEGAQNDMRTLRMAQGGMTLQGLIQAQEEKKRVSAMDQQFRSEIAAAPTLEGKRAVALKYASPSSALTALSKDPMEGAPPIVRLQQAEARIRPTNPAMADQILAQINKMNQTEGAAGQESNNFLLGIQTRVRRGEQISPEDMSKAELLYKQMTSPRRDAVTGDIVQPNLGANFDPTRNFGQPVRTTAQTGTEAVDMIRANEARGIKGTTVNLPQGAPDYAAAGQPVVAQEPRITVTPGLGRLEAPVQTFVDGKGKLWERERGGAWRAAKMVEGEGPIAEKLPTNVNLAGGRESQQISRILLGVMQSTKDLKNIIQLPIAGSDQGPWGTRRQRQGLFDATLDTLARKSTPYDALMYRTVSGGLQRGAALVEGAGQFPTNYLTDMMKEALLWNIGDPHIVKLAKLAQAKQILGVGMEQLDNNVRIPKETKEMIAEYRDELEKTIPFDQSDVISLYTMLDNKDKNVTINDVVAQRKAKAGGAKPQFDPAKEARIQEIKRVLGK